MAIFKTTIGDMGRTLGMEKLYRENAWIRGIANIGLAALADGQVIYKYAGSESARETAARTVKMAARQAIHKGAEWALKKAIDDLDQKDMQMRFDMGATGRGKNSEYHQLIKSQIVDAKSRRTVTTWTDKTGHRHSMFTPDALFLAANSKVKRSELFVDDESKLKDIFIDPHATISVSSKNNVVLTKVQGRKYTRKEFVSGGDYEVSINGKIVSPYPEVYPDVQINKFVRVMENIDILNAYHTVLESFNISQLLVTSFSVKPVPQMRNVATYTISAVGIEPETELDTLEAIKVEKVDKKIKTSNKMLRLALEFTHKHISLDELINVNI